MRLSIVDFPAKPAKRKKQVALKNHWGFTLAELRPRPRNGCINFLKKIFFFQNSWSGPQAYLGADRRRKSPLDGATDFLEQSDSTLQQSAFHKLLFWFWPGSLKMPLNVSELGLSIIQFISNLYVGVFLWIRGLVSIPCMLVKDCDGNPISTLLCISDDLAPMQIQSISCNVRNRKKKLWNSCGGEGLKTKDNHGT